MTTRIGRESALSELLADLIELDFDAIEAYRAAIERLESQAYKLQLAEFLSDHERHTRELGLLLEEMGEAAPQEGDIKAILTKGKVVLAGLAGDKQILQAMKSNEDETNQAYERALENEAVEVRTRDALARGLADERRHRNWLEAELERLR